MTTQIELTSYTEDISGLVRDIFMNMLGLEECSELPGCSVPERMVCSILSYKGAWSGALLLRCQEPVAAALASRLMRIPMEEQTEEDIQDAFQELANIVGGNLKPLLPPGCSVSLPAMLQNGDNASEWFSRPNVLEMGFLTEKGPFWISIKELA